MVPATVKLPDTVRFVETVAAPVISTPAAVTLNLSVSFTFTFTSFEVLKSTYS